MMKELTRQWARAMVAAAVALGGLCGLSRPSAAAPIGSGPSAPAAPAAPGTPTSRPAQPRSLDELKADLDRVGHEVMEAQPPMEALFDPAERAKAAPKAIPAMRKMASLLDELVAAEPRAFPLRLELDGALAMLGDEESLRSLRKLTFSDVREESVGAKAWVMAVDWAAAMKDPDAQQRVLTDLTALARANTDSDEITQIAMMMSDHAATPTLGEQAEDVVLKTLQNELARKLAREEIEPRRKLRALVGKPLVIEGTTSEGQVFSTADWKGKVILVDFWATWCPPCMAALPELKKAYADLHPKGLEVIGVTSDADPQNFRAFLQDNKDMPWPQLIDPQTKELHPVALKLGVDRIPTMFLIDKKGICRAVNVQEMTAGKHKYEQLIPKLLEEPAAAETKP
jgi:thiol-disulfide isomerase/thioredoxin